MIDEVFANADVTGGPEILGFQLRPLSIWHVWALKAMESPFVIGGDLQIDDICRFLAVCQMRKSDYDVTSLTILIGQVGEKYLMSEKEERDDALDLIYAYFSDSTQFPEFWQGEDVDPVKDRVRCPIEWHHVMMLCETGLCKSEDEAWDYTIAKAECWQAVKGEGKGYSKYVDARDRADFDNLNKQEGVSHDNDSE